MPDESTIDIDIDTDAACWCSCGWSLEFDEGALVKRTPLETSAKRRISGHIANTGCSLNDTGFRVGGRKYYREHETWRWRSM